MSDCYYNYRNQLVCYNSAWYRWGRWVVLGIIVLVAFLLFFLCSCYSARRRRRMGYAPYRGTGWTLGRTPPGHAPATYNAQPHYGNQPQQEQWNNNNNNSNYAPPAYTPAGAGANQEYYGGRNDVELQAPGAAYGGYRSGEGQYQPPKDPPPGR